MSEVVGAVEKSEAGRGDQEWEGLRFYFLIKKKFFFNKLYLFIYCCVGSLLLCAGFL